MIRYLLFAALAVAIGYACLDLGRQGARAYEAMVVQRATGALGTLGYDWARVEADGLRLSLHGHAPDAAAHQLALDTLRASAPLVSVVSYATTTLAPPERRDPVRVELLRDQRGVTLTGQTASRGMRSRLVAALAEDGPGMPVEDLTGIQAAPPPPGWGPEIAVASLAASRLPNAWVVMQPGRVEVDGQAAGEAAREALTKALFERAGDEVSLALAIRIPPQVIAPFAFSAEKDAGAGIRLERCAAQSYEEQAALRDRLKAAGVEHRPDPCPVGLGGPGGDWAGAVAAGLSALAALPAGRLEIAYRDARLIGAPPTAPAEFVAALAAFRAALPEGFSGAGELRGDNPAARAGIARELYWMELRRDGDGVALSGQVQDAAARTAIETEARALFGGDAVTSGLEAVRDAPPEGWQVAALRALEALAGTESGEARLAGDRIELAGLIASPEDARTIHDGLIADLPAFEVATRLTVDVPAAVAALPLPPARCAAELAAANRRPGIDFAPGSAEITAESAATLDALAAVFARCGEAPIEIAGHTDAQGPEEMNMRLSKERAEAVKRALAERGVPVGRMVARGYGETAPVATNETESGRAMNRRIVFGPAE